MALEQETAQISIADIMTLKQIVEVASQRGAFKAEELSTIGEVYDRVNHWLASVTPNEETADSQGESND